MRLRYGLLLMLLPVGSVWAQQTPPDPGDKIMREQMERERERQLRQTPPRIETGVAAVAAEIAPADIAEPGPTFMVERIELTGAWPGASEDFTRTVQPFLRQPLGVNRINLLLSRLNIRLVDAGYITSRVYVADQNLATGLLRLTVLVGVIEKLRYNGVELPAEGWNLPGVRLSLPMAAGDALHLRDIEQGIDQLNRLRRNHADVKIQPGGSVGGSIVDINNPPEKSWQAMVAVDNQGSSATGTTRYRGSIETGNLLGLMESFSAGYTGSLDTNALNAALSIPFGYSTLTLMRTWSEYQSLIGAAALVYGTSGNDALAWNYLFHRDRNSKATLDISLSRRHSEREINNVQLMPQHLAVARAGINHLRRFTREAGTGQWTADIGLSRGLRGFGADRDPDQLPAVAARSQFTKADLATSFILPLSAAWMWRGSLTGQYSRVPLFSSEQIYAGGVSSVRGFGESAIGGDRGVVLRNEWSRGRLSPLMGRYAIEPFLFVDGARVDTLSDGRRHRLASAGGGIRINLGFGGFDLMIGRPLYAPPELTKSYRINASLTWTI